MNARLLRLNEKINSIKQLAQTEYAPPKDKDDHTLHKSRSRVQKSFTSNLSMNSSSPYKSNQNQKENDIPLNLNLNLQNNKSRLSISDSNSDSDDSADLNQQASKNNIKESSFLFTNLSKKVQQNQPTIEKTFKYIEHSIPQTPKKFTKEYLPEYAEKITPINHADYYSSKFSTLETNYIEKKTYFESKIKMLQEKINNFQQLIDADFTQNDISTKSNIDFIYNFANQIDNELTEYTNTTINETLVNSITSIKNKILSHDNCLNEKNNFYNKECNELIYNSEFMMSNMIDKLNKESDNNKCIFEEMPKNLTKKFSGLEEENIKMNGNVEEINGRISLKANDINEMTNKLLIGERKMREGFMGSIEELLGETCDGLNKVNKENNNKEGQDNIKDKADSDINNNKSPNFKVTDDKINNCNNVFGYNNFGSSYGTFGFRGEQNTNELNNENSDSDQDNNVNQYYENNTNRQETSVDKDKDKDKDKYKYKANEMKDIRNTNSFSNSNSKSNSDSDDDDNIKYNISEINNKLNLLSTLKNMSSKSGLNNKYFNLGYSNNNRYSSDANSPRMEMLKSNIK